MLIKTLGDIVRDRPFLTIERGEAVFEAARTMADARRGAILVTEQGRLSGIFTERDLLTRVVARGLESEATPVGAVMTEHLVLGRPDESYQSGLRKMAAANCRHLPVAEGERIIGLVSRRELMALDIEVTETLLERTDTSRLFI
jgi:CBS domain-containing protein